MRGRGQVGVAPWRRTSAYTTTRADARWSDAESMPGCAGVSAGAATGTINAINAINAIPAERGRPQ